MLAIRQLISVTVAALRRSRDATYWLAANAFTTCAFVAVISWLPSVHSGFHAGTWTTGSQPVFAQPRAIGALQRDAYRCCVVDLLFCVLVPAYDELDTVLDKLSAGGRRAFGLRWGGGFSGRPLPPRLSARG